MDFVQEQKRNLRKEYLSIRNGMSEDEIKGIIKTEEKTLKSTGQAQIFPHFIVNEKMYFNKQQVDQWLKETQLSPQSLIQLNVL